jgi:hypothetical protein
MKCLLTGSKLVAWLVASLKRTAWTDDNPFTLTYTVWTVRKNQRVSIHEAKGQDPSPTLNRVPQLSRTKHDLTQSFQSRESFFPNVSEGRRCQDSLELLVSIPCGSHTHIPDLLSAEEELVAF